MKFNNILICALNTVLGLLGSGILFYLLLILILFLFTFGGLVGFIVGFVIMLGCFLYAKKTIPSIFKFFSGFVN